MTFLRDGNEGQNYFYYITNRHLLYIIASEVAPVSTLVLILAASMEVQS